MASDNCKGQGTAIELEDSYPHHTEAQLALKIKDGDEALKILHEEFEPYTEEEEKRVRRKIDVRLVSLMLLVNGIQFIDKNTMSSAGTYGIIQQADLKGQQFSLLTSIFYIGYILAQYPTNVLMQRFPTGKYISVNFCLWGVVLATSTAAKGFAGLAAARFFLGVFESCLNPGFVLITSSWWKREEQASRLGLWYMANGLIGVPSGFIFFGIAHLNVDHMYAYQWMFLIFGLITVVFGISLWWILPDSPLTVTWLNDRERLIAVERLKSNKTGVKNSHHKHEQVMEAILDPKIWLLALAIFFHNMTNSLQTTFLGIIIKGFGYTTYQSVLLSVPIGAILTVTMLIVVVILDRWEGKRIFAIIICYIPGIVSCVILYTIPVKESTKSIHLFAVYILPIVAVAAGVLYSLLASNVAGYTKKVVSGTMFFAASSVANIVSPQTFITREAPRYQTGISVALAAFCANVVLFISLYVIYFRVNKARDNDPDGAISTDATEDLIESFSDMTDRQNKKLRYKM
ncbi:hypothetical protein N7454_001661 [Penicillium verhagenii]|nr:hypothetical protein N7454_001661 [Penicillium verhagenii]